MIGRINFSPKKVSQDEETWKPDPSWPDIEKILAEDTEVDENGNEYAVKIGILVGLNNPNVSNYSYIQVDKYKTNKGTGTKIFSGASNFFDTTDTTINGNVYYAILYFKSNNITTKMPSNLIYCVVNNYITFTSDVFGDNCYYLEGVKFLNGAKMLTSGCFSNCSSLRRIIGTLDATYLEFAFQYCINLEEIELNDCSMVSNMNYAFQGCYNLKKIKILNSAITSGVYAFQECYNLEEIYINSPNYGSGYDYAIQYTPSLKTLIINISALYNINYSYSVSKCGYNNLQNIYLFQDRDTYENTIYLGGEYSQVSNFFNYTIRTIDGFDENNKIEIEGNNSSLLFLQNIGSNIIPAASGLDLHYQNYLTRQSMLNLINNMTGTGSITFGSYNLWKLTEDEKQMIIDKGWTYA